MEREEAICKDYQEEIDALTEVIRLKNILLNNIRKIINTDGQEMTDGECIDKISDCLEDSHKENDDV